MQETSFFGRNVFFSSDKLSFYLPAKCCTQWPYISERFNASKYKRSLYYICKRFLWSQKRSFIRIRQKNAIFSHKPPLTHLWQRHDVAKRRRFFANWAYGEITFFVGSKWNFASDYIKNVDTYHVNFSWK